MLLKNGKSSLSEKMNNTGLCAVTCYLPLMSSHKEVHKDMKATLGEGVSSHSMVKKWETEFKHEQRGLTLCQQSVNSWLA